MGVMDKVKSQAKALADKAQEGAKAGQEKLSQMQAKRQAEGLLQELGTLVYLERAGRAVPGGTQRADSIVAQVKKYEAANGPIDAPAEASSS